MPALLGIGLFFAHLFLAGWIGVAIAKRTTPVAGTLAGLVAWAGIIGLVIAGRAWWPDLFALLGTLYS